MNTYIESEYGRLYLTDSRAKEFAEIAKRHIKNLFLELREHKLVPGLLSLEKTNVRELDDYNTMQKAQCL